jgi:CRISPR-associated endonuclease Cas2
MKAFLVTYDLANDRLRDKVARRLQRDGCRVQESVFEVFVKTDAAFDAITRDLQAILGTTIEGQVRWYGLNQDGFARSGALGTATPGMPPAVVLR